MSITEVVEIIKKWELGIRTEIKNILNMARENGTGVYVIIKIPIRGDWRNKIYQSPKLKTLKNGIYNIHRDWYKNQRLR